MDVRGRYDAKKAEDKRRAQEREPTPWWWLGQRDPIARFTKWLVIWTAVLVVMTSASVAVLYITDHTLRDSLIANNRAWVWIEASVASDLTFEKNGDAKITLAYKLINSGPAPALNVQMDPKVVPLLFGVATKDLLKENPDTGGYKLIQPSNALEALRTECAAIAKIRMRVLPENFEFGEVIFPKLDVDSAVRVTLLKADIDEALKRSYYKTITPQLRLCVTYGFAVATNLHETGRVYDLYRIDPTAAGGMTQIDPVLGNVPKDLLRLSPNFLGSSYAN